MAIRSARNVEKQKKKNRRAAPRKKRTRILANTLAARRRLKKLSGRARAAKASNLGARSRVRDSGNADCLASARQMPVRAKRTGRLAAGP